MLTEGTDPENPVKIYTDGIFDCFHYGHAKVLEQCKKMFPYVHLVVGVCSDEDTTKEKGKPIMTVEERAECVRHCKWADEVILDCPWVCSLDYLDRIGCKYIAHDPEPYPFNDTPDLYGPFKDAKRFLATRRTEGISTTDIINRILYNYDAYVERSIKKGMKPRELNITNSKYFGCKINLLFKNVEKRKKYNPSKFFFKLWKSKEEYLARQSKNSSDKEE